MKIDDLVSKPKVVGIVGNPNSGKSNLLYYWIGELKKTHQFSLFTYGLRLDLGERKIYSVEEMERVKNSILIIDEFASLFDLDDRKKKEQIEITFRLIFHNNNVLILSGLPENYKKFISAKVNVYVFKECTIGDCINGSRAKQVITSYYGQERGTYRLDLEKDKAITWDGGHYEHIEIPYQKAYDTKAKNVPIIVPNKVGN